MLPPDGTNVLSDMIVQARQQKWQVSAEMSFAMYGGYEVVNQHALLSLSLSFSKACPERRRELAISFDPIGCEPSHNDTPWPSTSSG